jgi:hypothetical protein
LTWRFPIDRSSPPSIPHYAEPVEAPLPDCIAYLDL